MQNKFAFIVAVLLILASGAVTAIEEPGYEVIRTTADYEVRRYAPFIVAEVDVTGDPGESGNNAFRILADYIFGNNDDREAMNMTAPVVSDAPGSASETYTYAFVMESRYTLETLPNPLDARIRIIEKPARVIAARRYSGRWTTENYQQNEVLLLGALATDGLQVDGAPYLARYDDPFTLWFKRRNEVLVELEWDD